MEAAMGLATPHRLAAWGPRPRGGLAGRPRPIVLDRSNPRLFAALKLALDGDTRKSDDELGHKVIHADAFLPRLRAPPLSAPRPDRLTAAKPDDSAARPIAERPDTAGAMGDLTGLSHPTQIRSAARTSTSIDRLALPTNNFNLRFRSCR
jgi:hypothetical protein